MTSYVTGLWESPAVRTNTNIEMQEMNAPVKMPVPAEAPQNKEFHATHITTKEELIKLLQHVHGNPDLREKLLRDLDVNDPVYLTAMDLLTEDLSTSTLIIEDDEKSKALLEKNEKKCGKNCENHWLKGEEPKYTFQYYHLATKPVQAVWWTTCSAYKVWTVATSILTPVVVVYTALQSPLTPILVLLLRRIMK